MESIFTICGFVVLFAVIIAQLTQTGVIAKTADGNYTLTIEGTGTVYTKARQ